MTRIERATIADAKILSIIGSASFIESHGHSAPAEDIDAYVRKKYNAEVLRNELAEPRNVIHLIYWNDEPAGYSWIVMNAAHLNVTMEHVTELRRIYLLRRFYGLGLGPRLLDFNIQMSKAEGQRGMWLFVWKENNKAVDFYQRHGFEIIGSHDFKISATHSNPNHHMLLKYVKTGD